MGKTTRIIVDSKEIKMDMQELMDTITDGLSKNESWRDTEAIGKLLMEKPKIMGQFAKDTCKVIKKHGIINKMLIDENKQLRKIIETMMRKKSDNEDEIRHLKKLIDGFQKELDKKEK